MAERRNYCDLCKGSRPQVHLPNDEQWCARCFARASGRYEIAPEILAECYLLPIETDCGYLDTASRPRRGCKCDSCSTWQIFNAKRKLHYEEIHAARRAVAVQAQRRKEAARALRLAQQECPERCVNSAARAKLLTRPCVYCGGISEQIDHVVPLSQGGIHCIDNLVPSCSSCNYAKGAKSIVEFLTDNPHLTFVHQPKLHTGAP